MHRGWGRGGGGGGGDGGSGGGLSYSEAREPQKWTSNGLSKGVQ